MSFLNGALVLGALAVFAPLIIHLFNRSRFKIIKWGATHLLESVLRKNRRQIQLEQWIILIIRCAIPILLALALARMVVMNWNSFLFFLILPLSALLFLIFVAFSRTTRWLWGTLSFACLLVTILGALGFLPEWGKENKITSASGDVPSSTVILLDDSLSMNSTNGFSSAQDFLEDFLDRMKKQSETTIIQLGGTPIQVFDKPTSDSNALGIRIENLDAQGDKISLLAALDQALTIVSQGKNLKREIILLSDFRKTDWQEWDSSAMNSFRSRLDELQNKPELTWIDFGKETTKNLSVENIVLSSQTVGIGHPLRIRATLRNLSNENFEGNLRVRLLVDHNDSVMDEATISLGPQATNQVSFTHQFETVGPKVLHVEIVVADDLPHDNRRSVAVNVIDQIGVLLVDGDPSEEWLRGDTDFLKLALTPFQENIDRNSKGSSVKGEMKDLIEATVISIEQFKQFDQMQEIRLIVLANIEKLEDSMSQKLKIFLDNGGGLLVCGGNRVDISWYNQNWGSTGSGFLPMPIDSLKGDLNNELSHSKITNSFFEHPALAMFNDPRNGSLSEAHIKKWFKMNESITRNDPKVTVLARLHNGDAILTEKKVGKGVVMFLGTTIDTDWTNLPARPSYLPFVQQLATYLSEKVLPPQTVNAGLPLAYYLSEEEAQLEYELRTPKGVNQKLIPRKRKDRFLLEFTETRLPGIYELTQSEKKLSKFVVLASTEESILDKADENQIVESSSALSERVNRIDGTGGKGWETYITMDNRRTFGRETWKILVAVVIGLLSMEIILLRKFGGIVR